jgi:hypothetical protein
VSFNTGHEGHERKEAKELSHEERCNQSTAAPECLPLAPVFVCAALLDIIGHDETNSNNICARNTGFAVKTPGEPIVTEIETLQAVR